MTDETQNPDQEIAEGKEEINLFSAQQMVDMAQTQIAETIIESREVMPLLRHGQKTRLLEAMLEYPLTDAKFDGVEEPELVRAFNLYKRNHDASVALGVEVVIDSMKALQVERANKEIAALNAESGEEEPKKSRKNKKTEEQGE